jgi:hypothetical protein
MTNTNSKTSSSKSSPSRDVEVTAYTSGPAIFRETRDLALSEGRSVVAVEGLPQTFVPNSLTVTGVKGPGRLTLSALSYREPSLSLEAILQKAVGTNITLVERTPAGESRTQGQLLHVLNRQVVLQEANSGSLKVLPLSDRLELSKDTLEGLTTSSSLQLEPRASVSGEYGVSILFAAEGLAWSLNYEAFYDSAKEQLDRFACWVNLTNNSGAAIDEAKVKLIFGANTGYNDGQSNRRSPKGGARPMMAMAMSADAGGGGLESASFDAPGASSESVGEQKLYTLPDVLTIENGETKQVLLFLAEKVAVKPEYHLGYQHYQLEPDSERAALNKGPVNVRLKLKNETANKLGLPLPPGGVKIFEADSTGSLQRTDASQLYAHVAAGEAFELALNTPSKDLKATRRLTFFKDDPLPPPAPVAPQGPVLTAGQPHQPSQQVERAPRFREEEREIVLYNYKDKDVEVKVQDAIPHEAEFIKPLSGVRELVAVGGMSSYGVTVPKGGQAVVSYRIKHRIG